MSTFGHIKCILLPKQGAIWYEFRSWIIVPCCHGSGKGNESFQGIQIEPFESIWFNQSREIMTPQVQEIMTC